MVPRGETQRTESAAKARRGPAKPPNAAAVTPPAVRVSSWRRSIVKPVSPSMSSSLVEAPGRVCPCPSPGRGLPNLSLPAGPFLSEPVEEHVDRDADDGEYENDGEEL